MKNATWSQQCTWISVRDTLKPHMSLGIDQNADIFTKIQRGMEKIYKHV